MRQDDSELFDLLYAARRNAICSAQGQNSPTTNMLIDTTQYLIEQAISIIQNIKQDTPAK